MENIFINVGETSININNIAYIHTSLDGCNIYLVNGNYIYTKNSKEEILSRIEKSKTKKNNFKHRTDGDAWF